MKTTKDVIEIKNLWVDPYHCSRCNAVLLPAAQNCLQCGALSFNYWLYYTPLMLVVDGLVMALTVVFAWWLTAYNPTPSPDVTIPKVLYELYVTRGFFVFMLLPVLTFVPWVSYRRHYKLKE